MKQPGRSGVILVSLIVIVPALAVLVGLFWGVVALLLSVPSDWALVVAIGTGALASYALGRVLGIGTRGR